VPADRLAAMLGVSSVMLEHHPLALDLQDRTLA
jgi:hypothetical protein